jgi:hypothetical protein
MTLILLIFTDCEILFIPSFKDSKIYSFVLSFNHFPQRRDFPDGSWQAASLNIHSIIQLIRFPIENMQLITSEGLFQNHFLSKVFVAIVELNEVDACHEIP